MIFPGIAREQLQNMKKESNDKWQNEYTDELFSAILKEKKEKTTNFNVLTFTLE